MFRSLWLAVFSRFVPAKLKRNKFAFRSVFVPPKASPARRALIRGFVQRRPTLRTADTRVDECTRNHSNGAKHQAKKKAEWCVISLAGNDHARGYGRNPNPQTEKLHHPHPLSTHSSSRIGPAKMQARKSRAIRRDGSMVNSLHACPMGVNRNDNENSRCRFFIASVASMFSARFADSRSRSLGDFDGVTTPHGWFFGFIREQNYVSNSQ